MLTDTHMLMWVLNPKGGMFPRLQSEGANFHTGVANCHVLQTAKNQVLYSNNYLTPPSLKNVLMILYFLTHLTLQEIWEKEKSYKYTS